MFLSVSLMGPAEIGAKEWVLGVEDVPMAISSEAVVCHKTCSIPGRELTELA